MSISGAVAQILGACALLAIIPAVTWGYIFYAKQPEERFPTTLTFILGALAVIPILVYKWLWKYFPDINVLQYANKFSSQKWGIEGFFLIPLSVIMTFMIVGLIEEIMKIGVVRAADDNRIRHIDDAIEYSILAALGFSFTENILYFYTIWVTQGAEHIFVPFLFRSIFSTFAHILFSGIFGYFYGIAHFANPILVEEIRGKRNRVLIFMHGIFQRFTGAVFHNEKLLEGLILSVLLHAVYNVFLEMNWAYLMVPYLVIGYMVLSYLFEVKENHKRYDRLLVLSRNHEFPAPRIARGVSRVVEKIKR